MYGALLNNGGLSADRPAERKKTCMRIILCTAGFHWLLIQKHIRVTEHCYVSICTAVEMVPGADHHLLHLNFEFNLYCGFSFVDRKQSQTPRKKF